MNQLDKEDYLRMTGSEYKMGLKSMITALL